MATVHGWRVFPLAHGRKTPLIPRAAGGHGLHDATTDEAQIRAWFAREPRANYGIACGAASGLVVIDPDTYKAAQPPDPRSGQEQWDRLQAEVGGVPTCPLVHTPSGGDHLYLGHPGGHVGSGHLLGYALVDVKADGGYVVGPGCRVRVTRGPRGGQIHPYAWAPGRSCCDVGVPLMPVRVYRKTPGYGAPAAPSRGGGVAGPPRPPRALREFSSSSLDAMVAALLPAYRTDGQRVALTMAYSALMMRAGVPPEVAAEVSRRLAGAVGGRSHAGEVHSTYAHGDTAAAWHWVGEFPAGAEALRELADHLGDQRGLDERLLRLTRDDVAGLLPWVRSGATADLPPPDAMGPAPHEDWMRRVASLTRALVRQAPWSETDYTDRLPPEVAARPGGCGAVVLRAIPDGAAAGPDGKVREAVLRRRCGICLTCTARAYAIRLLRAYTGSAALHGANLRPVVLRARVDRPEAMRELAARERWLLRRGYMRVWSLAGPAHRRVRAVVAWVTPGDQRRLTMASSPRVTIGTLASLLPAPDVPTHRVRRLDRRASAWEGRDVYTWADQLQARAGIAGPRGVVKRSGQVLCNSQAARDALRGRRPLLAVFPIIARTAVAVDGAIPGRVLEAMTGLHPDDQAHVRWVTEDAMERVTVDAVNLSYVVADPRTTRARGEPPPDTAAASG